MKLLQLLLIVFFRETILAVNFEAQESVDPGQYYYANRLNRKRLKASGSSSTSSKKSNRLKYAFLQPDDSTSITQKGEDCHTPSGSFSSFQFMNFAIAAATLAGNLVANVNSNNRNNNNVSDTLFLCS